MEILDESYCGAEGGMSRAIPQASRRSLERLDCGCDLGAERVLTTGQKPERTLAALVPDLPLAVGFSSSLVRDEIQDSRLQFVFSGTSGREFPSFGQQGDRCNEKVTTAFSRGGSEVHRVPGTANFGREIPATFRARCKESELASICAMPPQGASEVS
jgi:hypothetical protein